MADFSPTIQDWIIATEGGYVDHPKDPGGATNMGITHKTLAAWRRRPVSKQDVKNLTRSEALQIYKAQYWDAVHADRLPIGVDYAVFDYAVNSGPARAVKDLQRVVGVAADGILGAQTLAAVEAMRPSRVIEALCERRLAFLRGLSTFSTFGRGWTMRVMGKQDGAQPGADTGVIDRAVKLSLGIESSAPYPTATPGKANPERPDMLKDPTAWTGAATGLAAIASAIADQPVLQVAVVAGVAFIVWRFIIARKQQEVN